jgi:hypothetical protein
MGDKFHAGSGAGVKGERVIHAGQFWMRPPARQTRTARRPARPIPKAKPRRTPVGVNEIEGTTFVTDEARGLIHDASRPHSGSSGDPPAHRPAPLTGLFSCQPHLRNPRVNNYACEIACPCVFEQLSLGKSPSLCFYHRRPTDHVHWPGAASIAANQ